MKKFLIFGVYLSIFLVVIYSAIWFFVVLTTANEINKLYANQHLSTKSFGTGEQYFIKFNKATPSGFPFKIAIKLVDWTEESQSSQIEFKTPIVIGYDLLKQQIFLSYSGEILALYKPLQSKFGSKINTKGYLIAAKCPFSFKLLKILKNSGNKFELINFIKSVERKSGKVQVFDLVDKTQLYDQDYETISFTFNKRKYYVSMEDLLDNIPEKLDIYYSAKINSSSFDRKITPASFVYGAIWPFVYTASAQIYLKTNATNINDLSKNLEIGISDFKNKTKFYSSELNAYYKIAVNNNNNTNIDLKTKSKIILNTGLIDNVFDSLKHSVMMMPKNGIGIIVASNINYILDNQEKFRLHELENRQYELDADISFSAKQNNFHSKINNFSLFSGVTGVRLANQADLGDLSKWSVNSKGTLAINNYSKIIDFVLTNSYIFSRLRDLPEATHNLYSEVIKYFLKTISNHPDSTASDIAFDYEIYTGNFDKAKIGSIELKQIKQLYYLALYKKIAESLKAGENLVNKIKELAPELDDHPKILEQLLTTSSGL